MQCNVQNSPDSKVRPRLSNFELLRIFAMLMIVAHHFSVHSAFEFSTDSITLQRLWIQFIQVGGKIGVDVFVLISGYFLINASGIKFSKILKLWIQLVTYSILIYAVLVVTGQTSFAFKALLECFAPVTLDRWWFASTYFVLYLISPFINIFLKALSKKIYQRLLVLLFIIWCLIPTVTSSGFESNSLLWFMYLYAISAYIRLWHDTSKFPAYIYHVIALGLVILTFLSVLFFDLLGLRNPYFAAQATYFYDGQMLPILLISVYMFLGFKGLNVKYSKAVNIISASTFGIYLIHDSGYVRPILWQQLFKSAVYSNTVFLIPYSIAVSCIVFIACSCIELLRIILLEKNYMKLISKMDPRINKLVESFFSIKLFDMW